MEKSRAAVATASPRITSRCGLAAEPQERCLLAAAGNIDEDVCRVLALRPCNVEVRYGANRPRSECHQQYVAITGCGYDGGRIRCTRSKLEDDDVGFDRVSNERYAWTRSQSRPDQRGVVVILGKPLEMMIERIHTCRGEDSDLTHCAAEDPSMPDAFADHVARSREH